MPQRPKAQRTDPPARNQQHCAIEERGNPAMQQVKADGAAIGIEDRAREQMVEVDKIGRDHHRTAALPIAAPDQRGDQKRREEMPAVVQQRLEEVYASIQSAKKLGQCVGEAAMRKQNGN